MPSASEILSAESDIFAAARGLIGAGRFDVALRLLASADASSPRKDVLLGAAHVGRRDRNAAFRHLRAALDRDPDDAEALFHLGFAHLLAADAFEAVAVFERVAALAPDFPGLPAALAGAYRRDARYEDAIHVADAAMAFADSEQLAYEKAVSQCHLGDAAGSLATYDALLDAHPDFAAAWFGSHAPALSVNGIDDALRRLRRAAECPGANGKYWAFVYAYELLHGRTEAARTLHDEKLANHPKRRPLADSVSAILPDLSADVRVFGVSAELLRHAIAQATVPGLVLEFGVRRGTSVNQIATAAGQTVHGFDSFEGLPESWGNEPPGVLTTGAELPAVRPNVVLHPGWFDETLPAFLRNHERPVRFVNIDSDIYSSAKTVLTALADRIGPGAILVFDEFIGNRSWREDEYKAFQEYVRDHAVAYEIFAVSPFTKQVAIRILGSGRVAAAGSGRTTSR